MNKGRIIRIAPLMVLGIVILVLGALWTIGLPQQTQLTLTAHAQACSVDYRADLGESLAGAHVSFYVNGKFIERLKTDQNGRVLSSYDISCGSAAEIRAVYEGDHFHDAASAVQNVRSNSIVQTGVQQGICDNGMVQYNGQCMTLEERSTRIISQTQQSVVKIAQPKESGSGVVLSQQNGETVILTNAHLFEGLQKVSDVTVLTEDGEQVHATQIKIAPKGMDLAVVYLRGNYGSPVRINTTGYAQGRNILVLGSPHGLQHSVSKGIISNNMKKQTEQGYTFNAIQHDSAMNSGNSGGGLFLESSGELIGINSFKMRDTEGVNFAIDINEFVKFKNYGNWEEWS